MKHDTTLPQMDLLSSVNVLTVTYLCPGWSSPQLYLLQVTNTRKKEKRV
jgi:hypothetical protein